MITRIPYRAFPDKQGSFLYCVFLNVQFSLLVPKSVVSRPLECLIDSGATNCLFHADVALNLGLKLRSGVRMVTNGIGGQEETWLHEVMLHLPGGPVRIEAGFKENLSIGGLLGMRGFFDHFHVTFDPALKECTLERIYQT